MLQLLEIRALGAPNLWGRAPVLECRLICEPIADEIIDGVFQRLQRTPQSTLMMERRRFATPAQAVVELALALERSADCAVTFGEMRPTSFAHIWQLAFEIEAEPIGRAALEAACRLLTTSAQGTPEEIAPHLAHLRSIAEQLRLDYATRVIVAAATRRNIPVIRLDGERLVQLGHGIKQHRLRMAATERTSFIAEWISRDKLLTKRLLQQAGIPVAEGRRVIDAADACRAAQEIGAAVVVKPCDADYGEGVTTNLTDPSQIRRAYEHARTYSQNILVERYLPGDWHRLLVVAGELVAAVRKEPPRVVGDGRRTIEQLITELNADPRRGFGEEYLLDPLVIGATVLGVLYQQGYSLDSVPPADAAVLLRRDAYLSSGATQSDVTDRVHPDIAECAIAAAETVGLDIAGIDVICEEVSRPAAEQSVGVLEVNSEPSLYVHAAPVCDPPRPVAEKIVESIFPPGDAGRIPLIVVLQDVTLAQALAAHLQTSGWMTGFAARHQARLGERPIGRRNPELRAGVEALFAQRRLEVAVIHLTPDDIVREGMPVDRCDLLCLAGLAELPDDDRDRLLAMFTPAHDWARQVLWNADHPTIRGQIPWPAPPAVVVTAEPDRPEWLRHLAGGGQGVTRRDQQLILESATERVTWAEECSAESLFAAACRQWIDRFTLSNRPPLPNGSHSRRSA